MTSRALVIATGVRYRRLEVPDVERFEGSSVYYAATLVEAHVCLGEPVIVIGGGNSAGQAAVFLAARASAVRLVVRGPDLGQSMSRYLIDRLQRMPGVDISLSSEVRRLDGDHELRRAEIEDNTSGEHRWVDARAVFVFIGAEPHTRWLGDDVAVDEHGFVFTGRDALAAASDRDGSSRSPLLFES